MARKLRKKIFCYPQQNAYTGHEYLTGKKMNDHCICISVAILSQNWKRYKRPCFRLSQEDKPCFSSTTMVDHNSNVISITFQQILTKTLGGVGRRWILLMASLQVRHERPQRWRVGCRQWRTTIKCECNIGYNYTTKDEKRIDVHQRWCERMFGISNNSKQTADDIIKVYKEVYLQFHSSPHHKCFIGIHICQCKHYENPPITVYYFQKKNIFIANFKGLKFKSFRLI